MTVKVRFPDFSTRTIARSLGGATDAVDTITAVGLALLREVDVRAGVRLLGIGVSGFATAAQESLFGEEPELTEASATTRESAELSGVRGRGWYLG